MKQRIEFGDKSTLTFDDEQMSVTPSSDEVTCEAMDMLTGAYEIIKKRDYVSLRKFFVQQHALHSCPYCYTLTEDRQVCDNCKLQNETVNDWKNL